jgi:hypothetical protein
LVLAELCVIFDSRACLESPTKLESLFGSKFDSVIDYKVLLS